MSAIQQNQAKPKGQAAKAARAEKAPEPKTVEFRGMTLELPVELPKTFMWDLAASDDDVFAYYKIVQSLLKPEQIGAVRSALAASDDSEAEFVIALLDTVLGEYGMTVGESEASQGS